MDWRIRTLGLLLIFSSLTFTQAQECGVLENMDVRGRNDQGVVVLNGETCCDECQASPQCSIATYVEQTRVCYGVNLNGRVLNANEITASPGVSVMFPDGVVQVEDAEVGVEDGGGGSIIDNRAAFGAIIASSLIVLCLLASYCMYRRQKSRRRKREFQGSDVV